MIKGLESLGDIQTPLNVMLENLAETIADKVVAARIKEEDSNKPKYYTRKELCEILHVTNPTVIEMVKRGEIREKKIGGRILYDAAEIDEAVKEKTIFRYKRRKNDIF
jgi:excisionase family DNA binding protein